MSDMAEAIRALSEEKGISEDLIKQTIENTIKAAYKRTYGPVDNCIVKFADDLSDVKVFARKTIVEDVYSDISEVELEEARKQYPDCELGDEIDYPVDLKEFGRSAVSTGKQTVHQGFNEGFKDNQYKEWIGKVGEILIGSHQREHNGNIYVDLNNSKVDGFLPAKFQSPREVYSHGDRIRAVLVDVKKMNSGVQLVLSRTDPLLVQRLLEQEVTEIKDGIVTIHKVVREPGYRTKIAVSSNKIDVDPVGACVGLRGQRIQNVIRDLEGEKIDVLRYDEDPHEFIKNALSPAQVVKVVIRNADTKEALAIVDDSQFSLAIGKQGQNVRLANRLCDWNIDVKTVEQAEELDLTEDDVRRAASSVFAPETETEVIENVAQLPDVDQKIVAILAQHGIIDIDSFITAKEDGSLSGLEGVTDEDIQKISDIIDSISEYETEETEEETQEEEVEEEQYFCPDCGERITLDMTCCPKCGAELVFEEE